MARGRPRDAAAGAAILEAARRLVAARGYEAVTTQMIAEAAGVAKQTVYRRWPSKAELVLAALRAHAGRRVDRASGRGRSAEARVATFLRRTFVALGDTAPALRALMAAAQAEPGLRDALRAHLIEPRRAALDAVLAGAVADGLLSPRADREAAVAALFGALWYRLLLDEPLDSSFAARLAAVVVGGLQTMRPAR